LKPENLKFGITINGITGDKLKYGAGDFIPKPNYKENANKIWSYTNNDPGFGTAITAMIVGKYSEAFICSNGGIIRKISSNGDVIWSIKENLGLGAITIDTTGYIFFVGRDDGKIEEIYCDDGGRKAVYERHAGAVNAIAMCGAGAICSGSDDGWIRKTYTGGTSVWSLSYGDEVEAIATDDDENTWAAGYNYLMKIDTNGNLLWKKSISAGTIRSIATDDDGNAYIGDSGGFVWKIAPDGSTILAIKINTGTIYSIMIDEKNNIYTASADAQVIKKDRDGDTIWSLATGGTTGWPPKMQKALDSDKFYYAIYNELNKIDQGVTLT
jgi:archaeosine-15-forming tRNA-guanine transglycosylase